MDGEYSHAGAAYAGYGRRTKERMAREFPRFRLRHPDGRYLNRDGSALVHGSSDAWFGHIKQLRAIQKKNALAAECRPVLVELE